MSLLYCRASTTGAGCGGDSLDLTGAARCHFRRLASRVPQVQVVMETVLNPQSQLVKNIVLIPVMSTCPVLGQGG